jgi:hypothetical protein
LLNYSESEQFKIFADKLEKSIKKIQTPQQQEIYIFEKNLADLQALFLSFTSLVNKGEIGGTISLLTTFNFGEKDAVTYYLAQEDDLLSKKQTKEGGAKYNNTKLALD